MEPFKRLHLFNGMLVTEGDWNAGIAYHAEKHGLHQQALHGAGIIPQFLQGLSVRAVQPNALKLVVNPGMAIDPQGRELILLEPTLLALHPETFALEGRPFAGYLYVTLRYEEVPDDFAVSETDARITGHRRVLERARLQITPDGKRRDHIELARFYFSPDVLKLSDARVFTAPGPGELDLRFAPQIGQLGGAPTGFLRQQLLLAVERRASLLGTWWLEFNVVEAALVRPSLFSTRALIRSGLLDRSGIMDGLLAGLQLEEELITLLERRTGSWERVWVAREFKAYKDSRLRAQQAIGMLINGPTPQLSRLQFEAECERAIELYREANGTFERLTETLPALLERGVASGPTYEDVTEASLRSSGVEPPIRISLEGRPFVRIDTLEVTHAASIEAHFFRPDVGANDVVQGTTPGVYPDGTRLSDGGLSYRRGSIYFQINQVTPGRDLLMLRRVELRQLKAEEEVRIDDQPVGLWKIEGDDREHAWRNLLYMVDGEYLVGPRPRVRLRLTEGSSPSNLYRFWFYQAV